MLNYFLFLNLNQLIMTKGHICGKIPLVVGGGGGIGMLVLTDVFWEKKYEQREANKRENVTEDETKS
jgi:hypothetical protein